MGYEYYLFHPLRNYRKSVCPFKETSTARKENNLEGNIRFEWHNLSLGYVRTSARDGVIYCRVSFLVSNFANLFIKRTGCPIWKRPCRTIRRRRRKCFNWNSLCSFRILIYGACFRDFKVTFKIFPRNIFFLVVHVLFHDEQAYLDNFCHRVCSNVCENASVDSLPFAV